VPAVANRLADGRLDAASRFLSTVSTGLRLRVFDGIGVAGDPGVTVGDLSEAVSVRPSVVSTLVSYMVAEGLVDKTAEGKCRRLTLTRKGRDLFALIHRLAPGLGHEA
jgi:DNA-binding MarR family transcriptional regulator